MHITDRAARPLAAALCAASLIWAAALPAAPGLRGRDGGLALAAALPYAAGAFICHQRADRSFTSRGIPWPVCARCSGAYLAAAAAVLAMLLGPRSRRRGPGGARAWRTAIALAAVPTAVSWALERAGWWQPGDLVRAALAVPPGAAVGALLASIARGALTDGPENLR